VLYINNAISDALMVARGFRRVGAKVCSVLVPYHGATGDAQHAIRWVFSALGPTYYPPATHPTRLADVMTSTVREAITQVGRTAALDGRVVWWPGAVLASLVVAAAASVTVAITSVPGMFQDPNAGIWATLLVAVFCGYGVAAAGELVRGSSSRGVPGLAFGVVAGVL